MSTPQKRRRNAAFAAVLMAGTALGGGGAWLWAPGHAEAQGTPSQAINPPAVSTPQAALPGFGDLVARVKPAVVTITATGQVQAAQGASPFPEGSPQDHMFRRYFGTPGEDQGRGPSRAAQALGSGFLVDAEGHVVTNNHVVADATAVTVTLDDGRELKAEIVGRDPRTDLAVLKVEAGGKLPFLNLGDSDAARPGDWVVAVGNPYGLGGTVTAGIVSARGRDIHSGPYDDFLQIDAAINRGNSGGPLFALDGSVIGVNTAIFSPSGGSIGIGFAIPSNMVKRVVAQLEQKGRVERGFLGASTQPVDPALAEALKLPEAEGALVAEVQPDSPAAKAGLKPGDVVTAVGDTAVRTPRDLARAIADLAPGTQTALTARRDGEEARLSVTLAALRDGKDAATPAPRPEQGRARLGVALATVQEARRAGADIPDGTEGAVVAEVRPGSPAAEAGLRPGDVILGVGNKPVRGPDQAVSAIRDSQGDALALQILRDGQHAFVAVKAPQNG
ncbi:DegQ family serine endoprotease [Teichococcus vastitatis]|uniref:DegQ family serine endoprotease n=1 Tax=Teichococcus vastitatis TaxID=2307076 RepID=UPI000E771EE5|nr:DegQ family serine endoprotease [Pseudoroseomonas vastitatis]